MEDSRRDQEGIERYIVQYEEYETRWDQEIQAKKCKGSINCILDRCVWRNQQKTWSVQYKFHPLPELLGINRRE